MKILSLFDGISCGQLALNRAGIPVEKYYASEIDKYAIKVTQTNYPDTIQVGDVKDINPADFMDVDMIIGGSPCQGFSFAGKQLNFNDERSKLFFEYVSILKAIKPKYFLLENVVMKEEYKNAISDILGDIYPECVQQKGLFSEGRLEPLQINSALVSAQNRDRLYWTNIPVKGMPADRGIMLKDIIDGNAGIKNNGEYQIKNDKSQCLDANYWKGVDNHKQKTTVLCGAMRGRYDENGYIKQQLEINQTGKTNTLTSVQKDNLCIMVGEANLNGHDYVKRVYSKNGKAPTLNAGGGGNLEPKVALENMQWRKLTVAECAKLQTVDPEYIMRGGISNSQAYKCLGNGWTIDVISHIFSFIKESK